MKEKLGQDLAFPLLYGDKTESGMNKRFFAACMAMQAIIANGTGGMLPSNVASKAYSFADELLKKEIE
jgi:hypothetical protein